MLLFLIVLMLPYSVVAYKILGDYFYCILFRRDALTPKTLFTAWYVCLCVLTL